MQDERIRLTSTDSAYSVDEENFVDVELKQHTKPFPFPSISETIDQRLVFEQEREESTKYRLIFTIKPFCTNILFNAVTEIVKNEGSADKDAFEFVKGDKITPTTDGVNKIIGKDSEVTNADMIRNTEYSNHGYVYHCGYDIFNNHILRNQTFKLVGPPPNEKDKDYDKFDRSVYNTINDYMRREDGKTLKLYRRTDISTIEEGTRERHLYLREDLMELIDCINANLYEQNGWWGFVNRSSIPACEYDNGKWNDLKISKVFNDENLSCGFIEMYPDSSLYSFVPKYNEFQHREEHNWDICITYPYENDYGYELVDGVYEITKPLICGKIKRIEDEVPKTKILNAPLLASFEKTVGTSNQEIILFRSFIKHNLNKGDKFKLYFSLKIEETWQPFEEFEDTVFEVTNVGDMNSDNLEYYFYTNRIEDFEEILRERIEKIPPEVTKPTIDNDNIMLRFAKIVNNVECKYYYRKFTKLPNFKCKQEDMDEVVAREKSDEWEKYLKENCKKDDKLRLFNKEQYKLAFSTTSYGDEIAQVTFTDTIDLEKLVDNLGRPLTELFVTIIKRNKGYEWWYDDKERKNNLKDIEFSHCFGELTSGIEMHTERFDTSNTLIFNKRANMNDVTTLGGVWRKGKPLEEGGITLEDNDDFYGDIVELDQFNMIETTLSDVCFRFNTAQRDYKPKDESDYPSTSPIPFIYDKFNSDDYDLDGFDVEAVDVDSLNPYATTYRPEGYYYKAHYPIQVREFGALKQDSHFDIKIKEVRPRQANGLFVEVTSRLRTGLNSGDTLYLSRRDGSKKIELTVHKVINSVRFLINPMENVVGHDYYSVIAIVNMINDEENFVLRKKNTEIPDYAYEYSTNRYVWRDVLNVGNKDTVELKEYPFANGHFYINKEINFFLRRQDPFGYNKMQASDMTPNDIFGNVRRRSNYEYKDDSNVVC